MRTWLVTLVLARLAIGGASAETAPGREAASTERTVVEMRSVEERMLREIRQRLADKPARRGRVVKIPLPPDDYEAELQKDVGRVFRKLERSVELE